MNKQVFHKEVQEYILNNLNADISKVLLKGSPFPEISIQEIAQQIVGKQKAKKKLPTWFKNQRIYYPYLFAFYKEECKTLKVYF